MWLHLMINHLPLWPDDDYDESDECTNDPLKTAPLLSECYTSNCNQSRTHARSVLCVARLVPNLCICAFMLITETNVTNDLFTQISKNSCDKKWMERLAWRLGWQPRSRRTLTTPMWPLLTPICSGVCLRLLRAFRSAPPRCSSRITSGSSPKAAWCTARSPSLSYTEGITRAAGHWHKGPEVHAGRMTKLVKVE